MTRDPVAERLQLGGCNMCTAGLVWLNGWEHSTLCWHTYFVTMPCGCARGQEFSHCLSPSPCACHACSQIEFQWDWEPIKWRFKKLI